MREELLRIPKAELHLHLRGAIPLAVLAELLNKYPIAWLLPRITDRHRALLEAHENTRPFLQPRRWHVDEVVELFRFRTFPQFIAAWVLARYYVRERDDFRKLVLGVLENLRAQNIVYAEITISLAEYLEQGVGWDDVRTVLDEAAQFQGLRVNWIVDLVRDFGPEAGSRLLREVVALQCPQIVGLTIGGSEHLFPPGPFREVYAFAREAGLRLTAHAGEVAGPDSIWDAIRLLGVERLGHGVRAVEDPKLVAYLAEHEMPLEVCPTSNLCTGVFPSLAQHSVRELHGAGVPITINTDDPTFFGTTLVEEFMQLHELGMTADEIRALVRNGFTHAFLPADEKARYLADLCAEGRSCHE